MALCNTPCDDICIQPEERNWASCREVYPLKCDDLNKFLGDKNNIDAFKKYEGYAQTAMKSYCHAKANPTHKGGLKRRKQKRRNTKKKRRNHKK